MQDKHLFEYAVIRVVPRVEREEFLNVGVILYCRDQKFLQTSFELNEEKLAAFCGPMDISVLKEHLVSFDKICKGATNGGPISKLDIASRFRWLTAFRSTIVQTSKVHPGFCTDAGNEIKRLYDQLVG